MKQINEIELVKSDESSGAKKYGGDVRHFTVHHDGVTIPVSRGGQGLPLVLCPGLASTQADLQELAALLRRDYDVVTFDLRGHGLASPADTYSFKAFFSDLAAVVAHMGHLPSAPILVGYSLGADLAVHYAAEHPDSVAGLVLIDGANPVPEPFITQATLPDFRAMWEEMVSAQRAARGTAHQVLLTAQEILEVNVEVDAVRSRILDWYGRIECPISLIISTSMAGETGGSRAVRFNQNWAEGIARLVRERPGISPFWFDADHRLIFTHAPEISQIIQSAHGS
ncbi:MAG: alpha/beta hydrolase [Corynebacteriales bacterium]|nr:alpha/beta hydrolase [Mycobacteriales bacterium]